jgi:hypothetical protein
MSSSAKIPRVVTILGKAIELKAILNNGDEVFYMWTGRKSKKGNPCHLASNPAGRALYILPSTKSKAPDPGTLGIEVKKAGDLYEKFTDWEMGEPCALSIPSGPFKICGRAVHIVYRSDKWTGKNTDYIHTFKHPPIVHVSGGVKNPKMIALTGGRIRVQPRGIVG